ncbi:hypothetical protein LYSHEL_28210 [Lysobacter helvus]|uniref:DUF2272 domain-containing protein n=2 Tax=Lysobacteraceae TaxID=32033 RepID=A0ABN6FXY1_9GAMM|nr:hypothetical protein LYSCAS_28180 [Lysobacter caseinilyticus]BCT96950.1 hypothetical protein LYSHEL_28210 [Lysobacter helvus]
MLALAFAGHARAGEPCPLNAPLPTTWGQRIASVACAEHRLWYSPFLDERGRLASTTVAEAENVRLQDRTTPAWRRVVDYWRATGLLSQMSSHPGANECGTSALDSLYGSAICRAFVIDTPWSAVFVTFVEMRASVPGFQASASHVDYVRQALRGDPAGPYRFADPDAETPAMGDLLCFTRGLTVPLGSANFRATLARDGSGMAMHCDIVVESDPAGGTLYTIGGNVLQGVTMRTLRLNREGRVWGLPRKTATPVACRPGADEACSFDRQDWVALLKLQVTAPLPPPMAPPSPACCTLCALPMPPGMQRCPAPSAAPLQVQPPATP